LENTLFFNSENNPIFKHNPAYVASNFETALTVNQFKTVKSIGSGAISGNYPNTYPNT